MPNLASIVERVFLHQKLLYWEKTGSNTYGKPAHDKAEYPSPPVILPCRWEDKQQDVVDARGRKVLSKGYLLMVNKILPGSIVYLAKTDDPMAEWKSMPRFPDLPTNAEGGREVLRVDETPDIKAESRVYEVYL